MRYLFILFVWLTVGLGLGAMSCGGDQIEFETIPCDSDSDCPSGDICGISGTCVPL